MTHSWELTYGVTSRSQFNPDRQTSTTDKQQKDTTDTFAEKQITIKA